MIQIHILNCDLDCQSHGCFDNQSDLIEAANKLLERQPFNLKLSIDDLWVETYTVNSGETSGPIPLEQFMSA